MTNLKHLDSASHPDDAYAYAYGVLDGKPYSKGTWWNVGNFIFDNQKAAFAAAFTKDPPQGGIDCGNPHIARRIVETHNATLGQIFGDLIDAAHLRNGS